MPRTQGGRWTVGLAKKTVSRQDRGVNQTRPGETAYGQGTQARALAAAGPLVRGLLAAVSHTCGVETSPTGAAADQDFPPLDDPTLSTSPPKKGNSLQS